MSFREWQSPNCEWWGDSRSKIWGTRITLLCKPLYYFGLYVKQISSALTRPTGTWLEPASLALTWLISPQQIMDPTWTFTGVAEYVHWHIKLHVKIDTRPFTPLMKEWTKKCIKLGQIHKWKVKSPALFFLSLSINFMASTHSTCFLLLNKLGYWENNLVCLFPRHKNPMAFLSPGVGSVTANTNTQTHTKTSTQFTRTPHPNTCVRNFWILLFSGNYIFALVKFFLKEIKNNTHSDITEEECSGLVHAQSTKTKHPAA